MRLFVLLLFGLNTTVLAYDEPDKYPQSDLYNKPIEIVPGVWSAIGATQPPTYANAGHNNNLSFIIGKKGILVVNGGASYRLAAALHEEIKKITSLPILYLVDENAQGHAMLGNCYWQEQGIPIIAHKDAVHVIKQEGEESLERMRNYNQDRAENSCVAVPNISFTENLTLNLGQLNVELIYFGAAHSAGDISVYVPEKDIIITGDMAFNQRMLPVFSETDTKAWIVSFDKFAALNVTHIIPGHGDPTDMQTVTKYTKDYLVYMHTEIEKLLEDDRELDDAYLIDQSAYEHLDTYEELSKQNAARIFRRLEELSF